MYFNRSFENLIGIAIGVLFVSAVVVLLSILVMRSVKNRRANRRIAKAKELKIALNSIIAQEAYSSSGKSPAALAFQIGELGRSLRTKADRQLMIDQIIFLRKNLEGAAVDALIEAYSALQLQSLSERKLDSRHWRQQARGIVELYYMKVRGALDRIRKLRSRKNNIVTEEALIAEITMLGAEGLRFLDDYSGRISRWLEIRLHHRLCRIQQDRLPMFDQWFASKNPDVVLFAIRMVKFFRQGSAMKQLEQLLDQNRGDVVHEAASALEALGASSSVALMASAARRFWHDETICAGVVRSMGNLCDDRNCILHLSLYLTHPSYQVRFQAVKCLLGLPSGKQYLAGPASAGEYSFEALINHHSSPLLM